MKLPRVFVGILPVALLATSLVGCAARSKFMAPAAQGAPTAEADTATVVFLRPSGFASTVTATILDEKGRFLGDSVARSYFAAKVPAGEHTFISCANNTAALKATLAPGKVYYVEVSPKVGTYSPRVNLFAVTLRSTSWSKVDAWMAASTAYAPDEAGGQANLAAHPDEAPSRLRAGTEALAGYADVADVRTLAAEDGR